MEKINKTNSFRTPRGILYLADKKTFSALYIGIFSISSNCKKLRTQVQRQRVYKNIIKSFESIKKKELAFT